MTKLGLEQARNSNYPAANGWGWGICPGCGKERRQHRGELIEHNRYHPELKRMVYCIGSHAYPTRITAGRLLPHDN